MRISHLPAKPGVYLLKNKHGKIIYIGKSLNIKNRVRTHIKDNRLREETARVDCIVTANEPEALIKESELIKKHQPKYNVMLRDDKQYFYVCFSRDKLPRLFITHQPSVLYHNVRSYVTIQKNRPCVGPFTNGKSLKTVLRYLRKAFPYYTHPSTRFARSSQAHRKLPCSYCHIGLCPGPNPDIKEYKKNIAKIKAILCGKRSRVLSTLKKEMTQLSKRQNFEKAAKVRDQIKALENIFAHKSQILMANDQSSPKPQEQSWSLGLSHWNFKTLEAYDISNIQGKEPVASMVRFSARGGPALGWDLQPDKSMYRRFRIRLPEKPDDCAMMCEVIRRRLAHREWPYPDLFLVDGGRGQLSAAIEALGGLRKVVALAKRFNELYIPGRKNPIPLDNLPQETRNLLMYARDEAHRFAITYHRKLHRKESML